MKKFRLLYYAPLITALPSVTIGAIAMYSNNVPITIWGQNIACLITVGLISYFTVSKKTKVKKESTPGVTILISILLLLLTFIDLGFEGVHRWISLGPVKFYISSIVMPILIIEIGNLVQIKRWWISAVITVTVSILLFFQPDASQLTAFVIPMILLLFSKINKNILRFSIIGLLCGMIIISWIFLDELPPVDYVEQILNLVANMGIVWFVLGIISLAMLPLPFILFSPEKSKLRSICIGIYFMIVLMCTQFGNFPVILMGYGISPIIGYFIAINWLIKSNVNS